jgi:hypothetical protein
MTNVLLGSTRALRRSVLAAGAVPVRTAAKNSASGNPRVLLLGSGNVRHATLAGRQAARCVCFVCSHIPRGMVLDRVIAPHVCGVCVSFTVERDGDASRPCPCDTFLCGRTTAMSCQCICAFVPHFLFVPSCVAHEPHSLIDLSPNSLTLSGCPTGSRVPCHQEHADSVHHAREL